MDRPVFNSIEFFSLRGRGSAPKLTIFGFLDRVLCALQNCLTALAKETR